MTSSRKKKFRTETILTRVALLALCGCVGAVGWKLYVEYGKPREVAAVSGLGKLPPGAVLPKQYRAPADYSELVGDAKLLRYPTKCTAEQCHVTLTLFPEKACHWGDIDLIDMALKMRKQSEVLLTVEPLLPATEMVAKDEERPLVVLASKKFPFAAVRDRSTRVELTFKPPATSRWGIFLCTDVDGSGSCSGKPMRRMTSYSDVGVIKEKGKTLSVEKVFYFQPLFWETTDELLLLQKPLLRYAQSTYVVYRYLAAKGAAEPGDLFTERSWALAALQAIDSVPTKVVDDSIVMALPYLDSNCSRGGHFSPPATKRKK